MKHLLVLDRRLVHKHFGPYPERGRALPCLPKKQVTVGWKFKFGRMSPDDQNWLPRRVALKYVKGDTWQVLVEEPYWPDVRDWLLQNCVVVKGFEEKPRKRRRYGKRAKVVTWQTW